jgi:hypothetical protein
LALKKENEELNVLLKEKDESEPKGIDKLRHGEDEISIRLENYDDMIKSIDSTWDFIISVLAPLMIDECSEKNYR